MGGAGALNRPFLNKLAQFQQARVYLFNWAVCDETKIERPRGGMFGFGFELLSLDMQVDLLVAKTKRPTSHGGTAAYE